MKTNPLADAFLFDLDGTLTDTEIYYRKTWPAAAAHFGYSMDPEMILAMRSLGRPFAERQFKTWFGDDVPYHEIRAFRKVLDKEMIRDYGLRLKPGAEELLQWLKKEEYTVALVTADNRESAGRKLEMSGILPYFDRIICAEMVEMGKPAPDIYRYACDELQVLPERAFAAEDSPNGVRSAYTAGCKVIMVPDLTEPDEDLEKLLYACVGSLGEIVSILQDHTR